MKIFISYKQTWVDDVQLTGSLWKLREILKNLWHESFIYYFDSDFSDKNHKEIINISREEIKKSDIVIAFVNHEKKSEWMLLELWIAFWLNKKVMILMNTQMQDEYYLSYWVSNNTILFDEFSEISQILHNQLPDLHEWKQ